ncbi:MAG: AmmeMemoRadiSam system protein A [Lachnospiraceae bacterium]|nr:AmmeMemoRadiSam system protein A [Lachnospiraceae bacterium]
MPVLASFVVPHPPLIVPAVGRGGEKEIQKTTDSYEKVAKMIASLKPDTIIISSPHSIMYSDYFHISPGKEATGSLASFRAPEVSFSEKYDHELTGEIERLCESRDFPAGTLGERQKELDHGTMVPLYFIRKYYNDFKLVRISLSGLSLLTHYEFGSIINEAVSNTNRNAVFVASGDLSHKLKEYGPYGYVKEGPEYDERVMDVLSRGSFGELLEFDEGFCEKAAECGHRSFVIMAGLWDGISVQSTMYSHEDVTGVGYGILSFYPGKEDPERCFLKKYMEDKKKDAEKKKQEADPYVRLAYETVERYIGEGSVIDVPDDLPKDMLDKRAGAFVSIHEHGALRGCIGTILPVTKNIAREIIQNAISASTKDPRFSPIRPDELPFLEINVDILGDPEDIGSEDELDVKRYGVIVSTKTKRGLLLPDLDGVDTVRQQVDIAKRKAGITDGEEYSLQRFEVVRHF